MVQLSSWVDLWDQASDFMKYHDAGINLHERLYKFLIDFAKLQKDAFIAQKRLCEKHLSDAHKFFGFDNSYVSFFNQLVQIVQRIIDAENLISCSFEIHASSEGKSVIEDERRQFKRWKSERSKLSSELKSQTRIIDDEIKRYRDKYRDMIKAKEDYERINADQNHSQFDVEKALSYARLKEIDFDRARQDYAAALDQFNLYRKDYYYRCLPLWAQVGKNLEVERYTRTQSLINILCERLRVAIDRMNSVCNEFKSVCTHLNSDQDSEEIIKFLHSSNPPPGDIAFVDLCSSSVNNNNTSLTVTPQQSNNSGEQIYSSGSVVLPSNFHCSVWAADQAAFESSKQFISHHKTSLASISTGEPFYGESASIYSTSYASTASQNSGIGCNSSRRPSVSDNFAALNLRNSSIPLGNGAAFFRRLFSRRSRHNSLNVVNCEVDGDGVVSGWSNPFFEPVVPWRNSSRQYQQHQYIRGMNSLRKKIASRQLKFIHHHNHHQQKAGYNNNNNNNTENDDKVSPVDIRASQSTGDLSVVNLKTIADLCDPARIKHQDSIHSTTFVDGSTTRETHISRLTGGSGNSFKSRDNTVTDASDFSDSNSELENNGHTNDKTIGYKTYRQEFGILSTTDATDNVAYASTSVLTGLPQSTTSPYQSPYVCANPEMTTTTETTHSPSPSNHSRSDSQLRALSSGREKSSIPLHYVATSGKLVATENHGLDKQLKQDKLLTTAPLAEPETASIVTAVDSFSRPTSTSLNQLSGSLMNGQMPTLKQHLLTNKSMNGNNEDARYPTANGNSCQTANINSNHTKNTLIYSQLDSSYDHHHSEFKTPNQILYNQNRGPLKKYEQQGLWYSQLQKCQQHQLQSNHSLHHAVKQHEQKLPQTLDNTDSTCSVSTNYNKQDKNADLKGSKIIAVGDCSALYPFTGDGFESCYLAFDANEQFYILATDPTEDTSDWLHVCRKQQQTYEIGYVPTAYVQQNLYTQPIVLTINSKCLQQNQDSDSSSTARTTTPTSLKKPITTTTRTSIKSPVNSVKSNRSNNSNAMLSVNNKNFRGTSPYIRLSGFSRDTDL
ncbi:Formin-binding protein 1 [Schistosoma japonicum]|nr:Formin-binding protein 1 [Schistosoma japonicum]